jgi:transcriptional regulator with XRE-family HTH domain
MARAGLDWDMQALAERAGVSRNTSAGFERRRAEPDPATLAVLRRAFERAGVTFHGEACVCAPAESPEG